MHNPFERSGLASLDDLSTPAWHTLFPRLESMQSEFLAVGPHVAGYPWPKDPLHNCIRVWEYPFVYHHLQLRSRSFERHRLPRAVDLGSGATFFPFAVARLGWDVLAVDADCRAASSLNRAIGRVVTTGGSVTPLLADACSISVEDESVDCVYCISVLEHVPAFEDVIREVHRILRPSGLFILTFDVDLRGDSELGPAAYERLTNVLQTSFAMVYPEKVVHPLRILTTANSLYPLYPESFGWEKWMEPARRSLRRVYGRLRGRPAASGRVLASTYGVCLRKPGASGTKFETQLGRPGA